MTRPFRDLCDPPPNYVFESKVQATIRELGPVVGFVAVAVIVFIAVTIRIAEETERPVERVLVAEIWR